MTIVGSSPRRSYRRKPVATPVLFETIYVTNRSLSGGALGKRGDHRPADRARRIDFGENAEKRVRRRAMAPLQLDEAQRFQGEEREAGGAVGVGLAFRPEFRIGGPASLTRGFAQPVERGFPRDLEISHVSMDFIKAQIGGERLRGEVERLS